MSNLKNEEAVNSINSKTKEIDKTFKKIQYKLEQYGNKYPELARQLSDRCSVA